jgi:hypothetical protein
MSWIESIAVAVMGVALVGWLILAGIDAAFHPMADFDGWAIWSNKGLMLFSFDGVPPPFTSEAYNYMHRDYPILLPLLESLTFRAIGDANTQVVHLEIWLTLVAFCGALAFLGRRLVAPIVWMSLALAVALAPGIWGHLLTGYADVPMALLLGIGVILIGLWLEQRETPQLMLATLFLAAAGSTKNEGATGTVCVLAVAALILLAAREWPALKRVGIAAVGFVALVLPWRIWVQVNDIPSDLPVGKGLTPGYLSDRADRIRPSVTAFKDQLADSAQWSYLVPIAIAMIVAALFASYRFREHARTRAVALFYLLTGIGFFVLIVWAYTITTAPLDWQIGTSADRLVIGIVLISVAAIFHLSGMVGPSWVSRRPPAPTDRRSG